MLYAILAFLLLLPTSAAAPYAARRHGDVVQLEDTKTQTIVSIVPSVGNIAFEMKVKGHNVLRWPYASVEEFRAKPALSGIPFLGPWANRLDHFGYEAAGKAVTLNEDDAREIRPSDTSST